jgi:site-specific recombinase XerD
MASVLQSGMLRPVRYHTPPCKQVGKFDTECPAKSKKKCQFVVYWYEDGRRKQKSLGTNKEDLAWQIVNKMVVTGERKPEAAPLTVEECVAQFLADEKGRGIEDSTLKSFRKFLCGNPKRNPNGNYSPTLQEFAAKREPKIEYLRDFTPSLVENFRGSWKVTRHAFEVQSERLKQFFKHECDMKRIPEDPAKDLKAPNVDHQPVTAFHKNQRLKIYDALEGKLDGVERNDFLLTVNLLFECTGLAPVDLILLGPDNIHGDHIITRRKKTGKRVNLKLRPVILERLKALPIHANNLWFWNQKGADSNSKHETATGNLRRMMRPYFKAAKIYQLDEHNRPILDEETRKPLLGHLYQWRHTFVHKHIMKGTSVTNIAEMIGDTVETVTNTYSHFIDERQAGLDESQENTWSDDEYETRFQLSV